MTADTLTINGVEIEDTFAEAFTMRGARVIITAATPRWARVAATVMTGFATSVIGCKVEAGIEHEVPPDDTPDGRPGISVLVFAPDSAGLQQRLIERLGQTVLTCPTTAVFDGIPSSTDRMPVGKALRIFGDGFQASKLIGGIRYWRVPVMEGEALIQETFGKVSAVGGGNFLVLAETAEKALRAAEAAVAAITGLPGVILPFPGGIARSGSKVGSKYKKLRASTNTAFAPTLRGVVPTEMPALARCAYEIVIDGLTLEAVERATAAGLHAALGHEKSLVAITAGNYGGKLGKFHFPLRTLLP